jgi:hypothetical protein
MPAFCIHTPFAESLQHVVKWNNQHLMHAACIQKTLLVWIVPFVHDPCATVTQCIGANHATGAPAERARTPSNQAGSDQAEIEL